MKKYEFHPIANAFPLIEGAEFDELVADVKTNGVREQVVLYEGKILDGRNRYRAADKAKCEPSYRNFEKHIDGDSPYAFVISANLRRRHMNESQRAMTAAELIRLSTADGGQGEQICTPPPTVGDVAKALNVSKRSVDSAKAVTQNAPKAVVDAVKSGDVKVSDAASVASEPKDVQKKALKAVQSGEARTMKAAVKELEPKHKSGKQTFDPRPFERIEKHLGGALRMGDDLNKSHPAAKFHRDYMAGVKVAMRELEDWRKAVRK